MNAVQYLDGAIMMAFLVAGLCYLRFWRRTRDRFFLYFAASFWIMAVNRVFLALLTPTRAVPDENHVLLYIVRFVAFAILLLAIVDKNRGRRAAPTPGGGLPGTTATLSAGNVGERAG